MWRPGIDGMDADEEHEYDPSVYDCLHAWQLDWPCLSFDVMRDEMGDDRESFPHSLFAIAGTQADIPHKNHLTMMRLTRLKKTRRGGDKGASEERKMDDDSDASDDSESDSEGNEGGVAPVNGPIIQVQKISHHGAVNRIRSCPTRPSLVATWGETGVVQVWDMSPQLTKLSMLTADAKDAGSARPSEPEPAHARAQRGRVDVEERGGAVVPKDLAAGAPQGSLTSCWYHSR